MKRFISGFLISLIFFMQIPDLSYAAVSTASNAQLNIDGIQIVDDDLNATSSNAGYDEDYLEEQIQKLSSYSVMPLSDTTDTGDYPYSNVYNMNNTVSPDGCQVIVCYINTDGERKYSKAFPVNLRTWSNGNHVLSFDVKTADKPDDFGYVESYLFQWGANSLPPIGKYKMNMGVFVTEVPRTFSDITMYSQKYIGNAKLETSVSSLEFNVVGTSKFSLTATMVVDFGNISYAEFRLYPASSWKDSWTLVTGRLAIVLEKVSSDTVVDITTAGGSYSSTDAAVDTVNNTSQIAQNTADMSDTLKEIVQTISNQLAALWDQMFNLMHLPQLANDDKNTDRIIDKLGEDLTVEIQNQDDNTETIINGYDSSEFDQGNDKLSDSLDSYDQAEADIFENIRGYIDDFEIPAFSDNDSGVLSALSFFSDYLQKLFVNIGAFNIPITVSLVMIFVLMLLGYYRVRSNG